MKAEIDKILQMVTRLDIAIHGTNGSKGLVDRVSNIEEIISKNMFAWTFWRKALRTAGWVGQMALWTIVAYLLGTVLI